MTPGVILIEVIPIPCDPCQEFNRLSGYLSLKCRLILRSEPLLAILCFQNRHLPSRPMNHIVAVTNAQTIKVACPADESVHRRIKVATLQREVFFQSSK